MKSILLALLIITATSSYGQIIRGSNFISISNTIFNKPFTKFDQYPDSTSADSTGSSSLKLSMMLNYHVAVSKHFTIGLRSRIVTNSESTYGIASFGPAVRYCFGFGQDEPKPKYMKEGQNYSVNDMTVKVRKFYEHASEERLKSMFFVEAGYMFGNLRFSSNKINYSEMSLQAGAQFRFPTPTTQLIRHFGLELSAGIFGMSDEFENLSFRPNVSAGLLIFLDRKYSSSKVLFRTPIYPENSSGTQEPMR